jgi:hypothetical protein
MLLNVLMFNYFICYFFTTGEVLAAIFCPFSPAVTTTLFLTCVCFVATMISAMLSKLFGCVISFYLDVCMHAAKSEFARWKQHWQCQPAADCPRAVLDALRSATKLGHRLSYHFMCILLRIMAITFPVTTAMG